MFIMTNEKEIEKVIKVSGMHCKSCAEKIEKKLLRLKGVKKASVNFVEEKAYVRFNPKEIDLKTIKKEIESLGYKTDNGETNKSSVKQGIIYGLIPHVGCISYIIASVLGVTVLTQLFKPLLLNPYFFYILILVSIVFATVSAVIYLKRQGFINLSRTEDGLEISFSDDLLKRKWKYLLTLYGTTIGINLLMFMVIFPLLSNVSVASSVSTTGAYINSINYLSSIKLKVDIPCPGHAPLISQELKSVDGVKEVQFSFPNIFVVKYDPAKTSKQQLLSLEVFKTYKATVLEDSNVQLSSSNPNTNSVNTKSENFGESRSCGCCNLR